MVNKSNPHLSFSLGEYKYQLTDDGSQALFSSYFDELCHSESGAYSETVHNYIKGCEITEKAQKQSKIVIFEVGFGTGVGLKCTLDSLSDFNTHLTFISCELDEKLAFHSMEKLGIKFEVKSLDKSNLEYIFAISKNFKVIILLGDVRKTFPIAKEQGLMEKFDAIYQDAFSPKKNPRLWTCQWFDDLAGLSKETTIMTTYSTTKAIWKAMMQAGWKVECIQGFGNKRTSTKAKRQGVSSSDVIEWTIKSPISALKDENINDYIK